MLMSVRSFSFSHSKGFLSLLYVKFVWQFSRNRIILRYVGLVVGIHCIKNVSKSIMK